MGWKCSFNSETAWQLINITEIYYIPNEKREKVSVLKTYAALSILPLPTLYKLPRFMLSFNFVAKCGINQLIIHHITMMATTTLPITQPTIKWTCLSDVLVSQSHKHSPLKQTSMSILSPQQMMPQVKYWQTWELSSPLQGKAAKSSNS